MQSLAPEPRLFLSQQIRQHACSWNQKLCNVCFAAVRAKRSQLTELCSNLVDRQNTNQDHFTGHYTVLVTVAIMTQIDHTTASLRSDQSVWATNSLGSIHVLFWLVVNWSMSRALEVVLADPCSMKTDAHIIFEKNISVRRQCVCRGCIKGILLHLIRHYQRKQLLKTFYRGSVIYSFAPYYYPLRLFYDCRTANYGEFVQTSNKFWQPDNL